MKQRKFLLTLLSLAIVGCIAFGLVGCKDNAAEPAVYTVSFSLGAYTGEGNAPAAKTQVDGLSITLPDVGVTWSGHTFLGWKEEGGSGDPLAVGSTYVVTKSVTLVAQWRDDTPSTVQYTVSFDLGEYEGTGNPPAAVTKDVNTSFNLPEVGVIWPEHPFLGWLPTGSSGNPLAANSSYTVTKNETLVAQWYDERPLVTFMANGSTFFTKHVSEGDTVSAPDPAPTHSTKTFHHWATEDGTVYDFSTPVTGDLTLDASFWVYVDYDINGASGTTPNPEWGNSQWISSLTLPEASGFTYPGYTFGGWYDSRTQQTHNAGASLGRVMESRTFTAIWTLDSESTSEWVEYTGNVELVGYYSMDNLVWVKIDVTREDSTLTYKVDGDSKEYVASPRTDQNVGNKLYYIFLDFGANSVVAPRALFEVSADQSELIVYSTNDSSEWGRLTRSNGSTDPGPVDPNPPAGESKSITFKHASTAPNGAPNTFPELSSGIAGSLITIPSITYNIAHYTFNGWNVQKIGNDGWESDPAFSRIPNGGSFTMPNYAIQLVSNFTKNYVTIKFDKNGGNGEMPDSTTDFQYGNNLSSFSSKLNCKFTGPSGANFLHWSVTSNGPSIFANSNSMALTEANGVTENDILTLYAIWGEPQEDDATLADYAGVWTNAAGDKLIILVLDAPVGGYDAYAYLKTNDTLYEYILRLNGDGSKLTYATDDDESHDEGYGITLTGGQLTIKVNYSPLPKSYTFTENNALASTPESTFTGRYTYNNWRWLFAENGIAYRDNGFSLTQLSWYVFDEYALFLNGTPGTAYCTWFLLKKSGSNLVSSFETNATFTASDFVTLTVNGVLNQLVNKNGTPRSIDASSGKKWVIAGTNTEFSFGTALTADTSIEEKDIGSSGEQPPATSTVTYTGSATYTKSFPNTTYTFTKFVFNEQTLALTYTVSISGAAAQEGNVTLKKENPSYSLEDGIDKNFYYSVTMETVAYYVGFNTDKSKLYLCDYDDELLGTPFTKEGSTTGGGNQGGETGGGDDNPPASNIFTFTGTYGKIVKIVINTTTNEITLTTKSISGKETEGTPFTATFANGAWELTSDQNPGGQKIWLKISADGVHLEIYSYATMDDEDLETTFTKA